MIHQFVEWILKARYGFSALLAVSMIVVAVNETSYRQSVSTLSHGIQLTDIRIKAAHALQLVTDAETSVRGYVITGNEEYLTTYLKALEELPKVTDQTFALIEKINTHKNLDADDVKSLISSRLAELSLLLDFKKSGKQAETSAMLIADVGANKMTSLRAAFDRTLQSAAQVQNVYRVSLYDAMSLTRWTVHLLILIILTGLYFLMRQLSESDLQRETEKERLEILARKRSMELSELAGHLVTAREDERSRLARELHDDLGALLTATKLDIARLKRQSELTELMQERLAVIEGRINQGIALKRQIIENLHPSSLDQLGLTPSLELLCKDMGSSMATKITFEASEVCAPAEIALTLYRVVQESLTNIAKYAHASHANIQLSSHDKQWVLCVQDDGQGFNIEAVGHGHHGLLGLRYRVESHQGSFSIASSANQGCTITVSIPKPALCE